MLSCYHNIFPTRSRADNYSGRSKSCDTDMDFPSAALHAIRQVNLHFDEQTEYLNLGVILNRVQLTSTNSSYFFNFSVNIYFTGATVGVA